MAVGQPVTEKISRVTSAQSPVCIDCMLDGLTTLHIERMTCRSPLKR